MQGYARESIPLILAACEAAGVTEPAQIAYILATAQHESHLGQWMEELASGEAYEGRTDLGNTQPGDGVRYKGRGYVQITGRLNYTYWFEQLGIDLVNQPELASEPEIAAQILVEGMRDGTFTGKGLSDYISGSNIDFYNARRIVNGTDDASEIAQMAERYYNVLSSTSGSDSGSSPDQLPPTTGYRPYYVKLSDTPSGIAFNELRGDASRWTEILKEDGTSLTDWDTTHLQVGQLLYLPFGYQSDTDNPVTPPPNPEPQPVPSPDPNIYTKQEFDNSWQNLSEYTSRNPFPDKGSNCTWYAHGRMMELGYSEAALDTMWGNAGMWDNTAGNGATVSNTPSVPCIAVWEANVGGAGSVGHVAVIEQINPDGSILISESNWPTGTSYGNRTIYPNTSKWPSSFIIVPPA
jgi:surface antigen/predicted chitinase